MSKKKLIATSVGTVGFALAIGYVMQNVQQAPDKSASLTPVPVSQVMIDSAGTPVDEPKLDLSSIQLTSVDVAPKLGAMTDKLFETLSEETPIKVSAPALIEPAAPIDPVMPSLGCDITLGAKLAPGANVTLVLDAPCNGNQRLTIHHTGMMVTLSTSESGHLETTIPALSQAAVFLAEFSQGGAGAVTTINVPELANFDRIALQWSGDNGFQLHAREFGASYGAPGHVWSGNDLQVTDGRVGEVVRLGDAGLLYPKLAEVYSFPLKDAKRSGTVDLSIEAEVTDLNCGHDIAAQSIEIRRVGAPVTQDLTLSMPDCSAVGDFLVLNNLVDDLKIAAR